MSETITRDQNGNVGMKIFVSLQGGLGNQLFQYAHGFALAEASGAELFLDLSFFGNQSRGTTVRYFGLEAFRLKYRIAKDSDLLVPRISSNVERFIPFGHLLKRAVRNRSFEIRRERHFHFSNFPSPIAQKIYLQGYWQSARYFQGLEDVLVEMLRPKAPLEEKALELQNLIGSQHSLCVNVRRGDFAHNGGNNFHGLTSKSYYESAFRQIKENHEVGQVFIFSDEPEWCRENLQLDSNQLIVGHDYAGPHFSTYLLLMSMCKYFVLPNSTFGWWAAWLAGNRAKEVTVPRLWFSDPSIRTDDLIPSDWTRL